MTGKTIDARKTPFAALVQELVRSGASADVLVRAVYAAEIAASNKLKLSAETLDQRRERERERGRRRRAKTSADAPQSDSSTESKKRSGLSKVKKEERKRSDSPSEKTPRARTNEPLPETWAPKPKHYELGDELGFTRKDVFDAEQEFKDWAVANKHRQVGRKSIPDGWDRAFNNWLRKNARDRKPRRFVKSSGPSLGDMARGQFDFGDRK